MNYHPDLLPGVFGDDSLVDVSFNDQSIESLLRMTEDMLAPVSMDKKPGSEYGFDNPLDGLYASTPMEPLDEGFMTEGDRWSDVLPSLEDSMVYLDAFHQEQNRMEIRNAIEEIRNGFPPDPLGDSGPFEPLDFLQAWQEGRPAPDEEPEPDPLEDLLPPGARIIGR